MSGAANRRAGIERAEAIFADRLASLGPGDLAIDCGANVGKITRRLAETGADVIAYEPDPVIFPHLERACAVYPSVTLNMAAVGIAPGEARLLRSPYFEEDPVAESEKSTICDDALTRKREGGWQLMDRENTATVAIVDILSVLKTELAGRGRIAVLKLDIEGMEAPILEAMEERGLFENIDLTIAELHPWRFPEKAGDLRALRDRLSARYAPTHVNLDWG